MSDTKAPSVFRLILWPSILTLLVNVGRLIGQRQGWISTQSGGGGELLGIVWLPFVFGPWFAWRLRRQGSHPRVARSWLWPLLALLAVVGVAMWQFSGIDRTDGSQEARQPLRAAVLTIVAVAVPMALLQFAVWSRLVATLFAYAFLARLTVVAITWYAKSEQWDSHYVKFGPAGIQADMAGTIQSASIAQLGFWVPFTVLTGTLLGCVFFGRRKANG